MLELPLTLAAAGGELNGAANMSTASASALNSLVFCVGPLTQVAILHLRSPLTITQCEDGTTVRVREAAAQNIHLSGLR